MRKLAVFIKFANAEIYAAVRKGIGKTFFHKVFHYLYNFIHIFCCLGVNGGFFYAKAGGIFFIFGNIFFRNLGRGDAFFVGAFDDFIVNVGKVLNKSYLVAKKFQIAAEHVKNTDGPCVADVDIVINSGSAGIDFEFAGGKRNKFLFLPCHGVKNFHFWVSFMLK